MEKQPLEVQTLYAELMERLAALDARRTIGHAPGTFVTKRIKGDDYYYFQYSEPGGKKKQLYLGKKDAALDAVAARYAHSRDEFLEEHSSVRRLATLLRAGGAEVTDTYTARVLKGLADAGVFRLGGVLVGTHAFTVMGNLLGVRWRGGLRTQDIDIAASPRIGIAVDDVPVADVPDALTRLEMGFLEVPRLDHEQPSTSFKVRGRALRVDLLTPARGESRAPVRIARLGAAAEPLPFLGFILEGVVRAAVLSSDAILVNIPEPARFALHKAMIAGERPVAMHIKRDKDLHQAAEILSFLTSERPDDIALAWEALERQGKGWMKRAEAGLGSIDELQPGLLERVRASL